MLIKGYSFYFYNALVATCFSWQGMLAILCLAVTLVVYFKQKENKVLRTRLVSAMLVISAVIFTVAFYSAIYDVEQEADFRQIAKEFPEDADCGTAWTQWFPAGAGLVNPCKEGCYRGTTLQQQIKMVNFPPWPVTRRELQCWVRKPPAVTSVLNGDEAEITAQ